ncbi:MAG: hypothetical protein DRJ42_25900 [Deltaproteobacteria bacterium]|nr:MAG: hypothetical protein DRJ42_25900 [Deltaproteobacteria bacterium]
MTRPLPTLTSLLLLTAFALLASACDSGRSPGTADTGVSPTDGGTDADAAPIPTQETGSACDCDSECIGTAENPGLCYQGICMTRAAGACASEGSRAECGEGSRCWPAPGGDGDICFPDCDAHTCAGACDVNGSCLNDVESGCDSSCSEVCGAGIAPPDTGVCPPNAHAEGDGCVCDTDYVVNASRTGCELPCTSTRECGGVELCVDGRCGVPPCTATSCDAGLFCAASGYCVIDVNVPPPGPPPTGCEIGSMGIPDWNCTSGCGDLVPFDPATGPGYDNYPLNGETESNQYRSFIRRDVMMLVKYATAMVACQTGDWTLGNGSTLGLGDMSEADGAIPGTSIGDPGHPDGTHVNGHDMDIGYYQVGTANNYLRPICEHTSGGEDQYHCTVEPHLLDPWRTSLFLAHLHINPALRVIGVDGQAGLMIESALDQLCADGWTATTACRSHKITWEVTDTGRYWFRFHHHHLHLSVNG